jgi:hypothetical protein
MAAKRKQGARLAALGSAATASDFPSGACAFANLLLTCKHESFDSTYTRSEYDYDPKQDRRADG